jgi:hypothetical protein
MAKLVLLHLNSDFTDESGRTWTANGTGASIDTDIKKFGGGSLLSAVGKYIRTPQTADLNFGENPFTMEAWIYPTGDMDSNNGVIFSLVQGSQTAFRFFLYLWSGSWWLYWQSLWTTEAGPQGASDSIELSSPLNDWHHVAVCRDDANNFYLFMDGEMREVHHVNYVPVVFESGYAYCGGNFIGNIDEAVITDACKWTKDFIPPIREYGGFVPKIMMVG